jgi:hypothetical protein
MIASSHHYSWCPYCEEVVDDRSNIQHGEHCDPVSNLEGELEEARAAAVQLAHHRRCDCHACAAAAETIADFCDDPVVAAAVRSRAVSITNGQPDEAHSAPPKVSP